MLDGLPDEVHAIRRQLIDEKVVDGEAAFLDKRAHFGEARVLVPAAALVEVGEGDEAGGENEEFETLEAGHGREEQQEKRAHEWLASMRMGRVQDEHHRATLPS